MSVEQEIDALVARARVLAGEGDARQAFRKALAEIVVPAERLALWQDGADIVGRAYERVIDSDARRERGQFFTPFWAGDLIAGWLFREPRRLLLDPGCGSGALLISAARHPARGQAKLLGLDADDLAVAMARRNRQIRKMRSVHLRVRNFLTEPVGVRPDALACNPPYTRHQTLTAAEKHELYTSFERRLDLKLNGRTPLQILFLVRALECCAAGGALAFITPTGWLDADYGAPIKSFLTERAHLEARIVFEAGELFFPGARTTAEISLITNAPSTEKTRVVRLPRALPSPETVLEALAACGSDALAVTTQRLRSDRPWSRRRVGGTGTKLGDVARVRRGIATGCNRFFVISEAKRVELGLDTATLRACITSPRLVAGTALTAADLDALADDVPRWLLDCDDVDADKQETPLGRYLRSELGERAKASYLAQQRTLWFAPEKRNASPILYTYFNKTRVRFIRNHANAVPLNTFLIIEPNDGVDTDELCRRLNAVNVGALGRSARVYGGGLWKLEPSELAQIVVPPLERA